MEFEEVLVNGEIVKVAVKIDDSLNADIDPIDEPELLMDTTDYSNLFENTIEIEKDNLNE